MNPVAFIVIAIVTLAGALAAALLPRLIHAALCLVVAFFGIAAFYFLLGAEFVGLVQIFVYVGAVAVLIVFTILLTRRDAIAIARLTGAAPLSRWRSSALSSGQFFARRISQSPRGRSNR
jgi:NADH-quinone oxidoreductase subunit J